MTMTKEMYILLSFPSRIFFGRLRKISKYLLGYPELHGCT